MKCLHRRKAAAIKNTHGAAATFQCWDQVSWTAPMAPRAPIVKSRSCLRNDIPQCNLFQLEFFSVFALVLLHYCRDPLFPQDIQELCQKQALRNNGDNLAWDWNVSSGSRICVALHHWRDTAAPGEPLATMTAKHDEAKHDGCLATASIAELQRCAPVAFSNGRLLNRMRPQTVCPRFESCQKVTWEETLCQFVHFSIDFKILLFLKLLSKWFNFFADCAPPLPHLSASPHAGGAKITFQSCNNTGIFQLSPYIVPGGKFLELVYFTRLEKKSLGEKPVGHCQTFLSLI